MGMVQSPFQGRGLSYSPSLVKHSSFTPTKGSSGKVLVTSMPLNHIRWEAQCAYIKPLMGQAQSAILGWKIPPCPSQTIIPQWASTIQPIITSCLVACVSLANRRLIIPKPKPFPLARLGESVLWSWFIQKSAWSLGLTQWYTQGIFRPTENHVSAGSCT